MAGSHDDSAPRIVDARGLRCPLPVIHLARAASTAPSGSVVELWASDPAARHDVPAWARMRGHTVLDGTDRPVDDAPTWRIRVLLG